MDNQLILQADFISAEAAQDWVRHSPTPLPPTGTGVVRLPAQDAPAEDFIRRWSQQHRVDWAWVPTSRRSKDFGLLAMDMDSTLIAVECIDEIADMLGLKPQVAAITESAMRGEIEFAESLRRRVALLAGLPAAELERVYDERVRLNRGAETLLAHARAQGIRTLLVSGGFTFFTDRLKDRLGLDYTAANTLEIDNGRLTGRVEGRILDARGKAEQLVQTAAHLGLAPGQTIAIGDGANDLHMLDAAGVSIAFHAKPVVQERAQHAINFGGLDTAIALLGA